MLKAMLFCGSGRRTRACNNNNNSSGLRWDSATQQVKSDKKPNTCLVSRAVQEQILPVVFSEKDGAVRPQYLLVNGLTGKMGQAVAEAASRVAGLELVPHSLCSSRRSGDEWYLRIGEVNVEIHSFSEKDAVLDRVAQEFPGVIVVDYTVPASVNENAEAYCKRQLPFVMGTTGGDRVKLLQTVNDAGSYAVIAPNMGKQIVAFQVFLEIMASQDPGAFAGCNLKIRDPEKQKAMGVPDEYLNAHAFHSYTVTSAKDQSFTLKFEHNTCGREIYAEGTIDAVLFLAKQIREKAEKKFYTMVDVFREGNMKAIGTFESWALPNPVN